MNVGNYCLVDISCNLRLLSGFFHFYWTLTLMGHITFRFPLKVSRTKVVFVDGFQNRSDCINRLENLQSTNEIYG